MRERAGERDRERGWWLLFGPLDGGAGGAGGAGRLTALGDMGSCHPLGMTCAPANAPEKGGKRIGGSSGARSAMLSE